MKRMKKHMAKIVALLCAVAMVINVFYGIGFKTEAAEKTPASLGYARLTPGDFGFADGEYTSTNHMGKATNHTFLELPHSLHKKYVDMDVAISGNASGENAINIASADGWGGIRVGVSGTKICIFDAYKGVESGLAFSADALGLTSTSDFFNLKLGFEYGAFSDATTCKTLKVTVWAKDAYMGEKTFSNVEKAGHGMGVYTSTSTIRLESPKTQIRPEDYGFSRVTTEDFGFGDATFTKGWATGDHGAGMYLHGTSLDMKYFDMDLAFNSTNGNTHINLASTDGWHGVRVMMSNSWFDGKTRLCIMNAGSGDITTGYYFEAAELGLADITDAFNLKLGLDLGTIDANNTCDSVTMHLWINDKYMGTKTMANVTGIAHGIGICANDASQSVTIATPFRTRITSADFSFKEGNWTSGTHGTTSTPHSYGTYPASADGKYLDINIRYGKKNTTSDNLLYLADAGWNGIGIGMVGGKLIFDGQTGTGEYSYNADAYGLVPGRMFNLKLYTKKIATRADGMNDVLLRAKVNNQDLPLMKFTGISAIGNSMGVYTPNGSIATKGATAVNNAFTFALDEDYSKVYASTKEVEVVLKPSIHVIGDYDKAMYTGLKVQTSTTTFTPVMKKTNRGALTFTIPADYIAADGSTVTVKAGALKNVEHTVTMDLSADYSFYVNGYGISAGSALTMVANQQPVTIAGGTIQAPTMTTTDTLAAGVGNLYAVKNPNEGVFVGGIKDEDAYLTKDSATSYTIHLSMTPVTSEVLVINGTFTVGSQMVKFATASAVWSTSGAWVSGASSGRLVTIWETYDATDTPYIIKTQNTTVDGVAVALNTPLMEERSGSNPYKIERTIGNVTVAQDLILTRTAHTGASKTDAVLPTEIIGTTGSGRHITSVTASSKGTTVIGMSDTNNGYQPKAANFDNYGFDYVLDFDSDRRLKVLQITDTQIIDSAQQRTADRLGEFWTTAWAPEKMDENLFSYIRELLKKTNPDLILLTGDLIYGEFDDNGTALQALVKCMEDLKVPWAPIYGNHDNESNMGVLWQNKQFEDAKYCLFNRRHAIGGNGNYSIGISRNGSLERVIYMMDSNGCTHASTVKDADQVITAVGMTQAQREWYYHMALQTNALAGRTVPNMLGFHIQTNEVVEAAEAAGYQWGGDDAHLNYTIGEDVEAQAGDSGFKNVAYSGGTHEEKHLLEYMNKTGGDGVFLGHIHNVSTSVSYSGVRWTFGLKTGTYDSSPSKVGGTVIQLNADSSKFTVTHVPVTPSSYEVTDTVRQSPVHYDLAKGPYLLKGENVEVDGLSGYTGWELDEPGDYEVASMHDEVQYVKTVSLFYVGDVNLNGKAGEASDWARLEAMVYDPDVIDSVKTLKATQYAADLDNDGKVGFTDVHLAQSIVKGETTLDAVIEKYYVPVLTYDYIGGDEVMPITGSFGPYKSHGYDFATDDIYKKIKDVGINMINNTWNDFQDDKSAIHDILKMQDKYNIGILISDRAVNPIIDIDSNGSYYLVDGANVLSATEMAQAMGHYSTHESYLGNYVLSGPLPDEAGVRANGKEYMEMQYYADTLRVLNSYANGQGFINMLGSPTFGNNRDTYKAYVEELIKRTKPAVLTGDAYPFDLSGCDATNAVPYFVTLDIIRNASLEYDIPFWSYVSAGGDNRPDEHTGLTDQDRIPSEAETYWNASTVLALGAKGIEWFPLIQPYYYAYNGSNEEFDTDRQGLIDMNGENNVYYDWAKNVNEHVTAIDEVLMRSQSAGVIMTEGHGFTQMSLSGMSAKLNATVDNTAWEGHHLKAVETDNKEYGAMVGCFDYRETEAYYVVNYDVTKEQTITLKLDGSYDYRQIADAKETYGTSDTITLTIPAGKGILIALEDRTVAFDSVSEYRGTIGFAGEDGSTLTCERSIDLANEISSYAAPDAEPGYVFAGWYVDGTAREDMDRTNYLGTDVQSGRALAKFLPDETLMVKAQNQINPNDSSKRDLRFVTTVDNLEYYHMGYDVTVGDRSTITNKSRWVYSELLAEGKTRTPDEWCQFSNWFKAVHITGFPESMFDTPVTASPFWITWDGTKVYGDSVTKTINQGLQ